MQATHESRSWLKRWERILRGNKSATGVEGIQKRKRKKKSRAAETATAAAAAADDDSDNGDDDVKEVQANKPSSA